MSLRQQQSLFARKVADLIIKAHDLAVASPVERVLCGDTNYTGKQMTAIELDEAERMAIDSFLAEHWSKFCRVADQFLTPEEIEALGEKLSGNDGA